MKTNFLRLVAAAVVATFVASQSQAATFIAPGWNIGDPGTTSQHWEALGPVLPITTNLTHISNPAVAPPVFSHGPAAVDGGASFVASSGGLYSFSGHYNVTTDISNIGGPGLGTTVLVQTAGTLNPDWDPEGDATGASAFRDSFSILDSDGNVLVTAALGEVVRTLYDPSYSSSFGEVQYEELAWEVFLPGYTGDFSVTFDMIVHSSLANVFITSAITPVPEPATVLLLGMGAVGLPCIACVGASSPLWHGAYRAWERE